MCFYRIRALGLSQAQPEPRGMRWPWARAGGEDAGAHEPRAILTLAPIRVQTPTPTQQPWPQPPA